MRTLLLLAVLCGCSDDGGREPGESSFGGPMLGSCFDDCPIGGPDVCGDGMVCASIVPGGGGNCMIACTPGSPDACVVDGYLIGRCRVYSPDTYACEGQNGPVCVEEP